MRRHATLTVCLICAVLVLLLAVLAWHATSWASPGGFSHRRLELAPCLRWLCLLALPSRRPQAAARLRGLDAGPVIVGPGLGGP